MNLQQTQNKVLEFLFEGYIEYGGNPIFSISEVITAEDELTPEEIGKHLLNQGLIKDQRFFPNDFQCGISISGISAIRPNYFDEYASRLMSTLGLTGNEWLSIMEALEFEPKAEMRARDLAKVLEASQLFEVLYQADVYVRLTLLGRETYERNKPTFF